MKQSMIVALLLALSGCAGTKSSMTSIDLAMRDYNGNVPGASVVVMKDGAIEVSASYGLADVENQIVATPATNYRLASVTKQFTATAIMLLEERGLLSYDDRIARFLPSLPPATSNITVRHLLSHTSGIVDYEDLVPEGQTEQLHDRDVLLLLEREDRLRFDSGSAYEYSNSGYALLALIVEKVSQRSFADFLRAEIFEPLQMQETVAFVDGRSKVTNRAFGYTSIEGRFVRTDQSTTSAVLGDGGIYSSINDLAKWERGLVNGLPASLASLNRAWSPSTRTDRPEVTYGFGWRITDYKGTRMLWHSGETRGFRNVLLRFPEERLMVALLTNRNDPASYETALRIADLYLPAIR